MHPTDRAPPHPASRAPRSSPLGAARSPRRAQVACRPSLARSAAAAAAAAAAAGGRGPGGGGGRAEAEPHGRPIGLAGWGVCTSFGGLARRSASGSEGCRLGSSLFLPFSCRLRQPATGEFRGTFQSRDARVARDRPAEGARGRPPPRPEKLRGPAPGCPRVSHLGISEAAFHVTSMWKLR